MTKKIVKESWTTTSSFFKAALYGLKLCLRYNPITSVIRLLLCAAPGFIYVAIGYASKLLLDNVSTASWHWLLLYGLGAMAALYLINSGGRALNSSLRSWMQMGVALEFDRRVLRSMRNSSALAYQDERFQSLLHALEGAGQNAFEIVDASSVILQSTITFVLSAALLWRIQPLLAILVVSGILPSMGFSMHSMRQVWSSFGPQQAEKNLLRHYQDAFFKEATHSETQVFRSFAYFQEKIELLTESIEAQSARQQLRSALPGNLFALYVALCQGGALCVLILQISRGQARIGDYLLFTTACSGLFNIFNAFINFDSLQQSAGKIAMMQHLFAAPEWQEPSEAMQSLSEPVNSIRLEGVWFAYKGKEWILQDLSLTLKKGEYIALVGLNGAGKTTLCKLLVGLYTPIKGTIYYNGIPHTKLSMEEIRAHCTMILQDYSRYGLSLIENVLFDRTTDPQAQRMCKDVATALHMQDHVASLPESWNTPMLPEVREHGQNLSGGQWQRIAAARGFSRKADLFIMDEPSASMDAQTEQYFYDLANARTDYGIRIIISHRLACMQHVTRIIVLENGRIIEDGSHDDLLRDKGIYQKLYAIQSSKYQNMSNHDEAI